MNWECAAALDGVSSASQVTGASYKVFTHNSCYSRGPSGALTVKAGLLSAPYLLTTSVY